VNILDCLLRLCVLTLLQCSATDDDAQNATTSSWNAKENPELAGKDIGTQMAHMVEIDLPDF
jgi:hypothetical protein